MDIKEFTKDTIVQIIEGVNEANESIRQSGAKICSNYGEKPDCEAVFDVAVTVVGSEEAQMGGKIQIAQVFGIGASNSETITNQQVSRIQYTVPIKFPKDESRKDTVVMFEK